MKRTITLFFILGALSWSSCNSNRQEAPANTPPPTEVKTVVVDTVHKDEQKEGTSIKISDEGMIMENKSGTKKTNVTISRDSSELEISRPK